MGSLLIDHPPFRVRAIDEGGRRIPGGRVAFDVFCAVGCSAGRPRLWRAEAFSSARPGNWSAFLGSSPGEPRRIVSDALGGMLAAIAARWPQVEPQRCERHPRQALERLLAKRARDDPSEELKQLRAHAEGALAGPFRWRAFVCAARVADDESLAGWIAVSGPVIEAQCARREPSSRRPADMPPTTAALEQLTRPIIVALHRRRYALKNRERLNRPLMLLQLHINGDDDVRRYARTIRTWLEANGGRPADRRRALADPVGAPTLR